MTKPITTDHYFGGCPECGKVDGMANVYKTHWFYCQEHKTMWSPGSNLFSIARMETLEFQKERWDKIGLEEFLEVNPILPEEFCNSIELEPTLGTTGIEIVDLEKIHNYLFGDDDACL